MRRILSVFSLLSLPMLAEASYWNHNGSVMWLSADGNSREFYYDQPSKTMRGAGVVSGTLLFNGYRQGNRYYGTARRFSKYCAYPIEYEVSGRVVTETKVVLTGRYPSYAAGCRPTGQWKDDRLVFTYLHR